MDYKSKVNFKTPSGLKIRLNYRYFFCQLTKPERYYTDDEITNNDTMNNAVANIESLYLIPTALIQVFSIFTIIFHVDLPLFYIVSSSLYIFGCLWRCAEQDFLLSTVLLFLSTLYKALWWLLYIALIILAFVFDSTYLIIPYLLMRTILCVFSFLQNHIILFLTKKKFGVPFNDTEICAFIVFHLFTESDMKISDYISSYVSAIYQSKSEVNL